MWPPRSNERFYGDMERCTKLLREIYNPLETTNWLLAKQPCLGGQSPAQVIAEARTAEVERVIQQLKSGAELKGLTQPPA
jgi:hypothetical protein